MPSLLPFLGCLGRGGGPPRAPLPQSCNTWSWLMAPVWPMFHSQPIPWQRGWAQGAAGGSPVAGGVGPATKAGLVCHRIAMPCSLLAGKNPPSHRSKQFTSHLDRSHSPPSCLLWGVVSSRFNRGSSVGLGFQGVSCGCQSLLKAALPLSP